MISTHISCDHNTYHIRFRDTWLQREKEATRPFTFQPKALEMFENQYKSELLIRSHPRGRGFESLQVHHKVRRNSKLRWTFVYRQNGGTSLGMSRRFVVFCFLIGYLSACFLRLPQVTAPAAPPADRVSSESHSTVRPLSPVFGEELSPELSGWPADPVAGISTAAFL